MIARPFLDLATFFKLCCYDDIMNLDANVVVEKVFLKKIT
jgi:hypothetical protein